MIRPLEELRRAIIAGDPVDMDGNAVIIKSSTRLDRSLPTNFHSMRGRGDAYPLETVFFQYKNRDLVYNNYVQTCRKEGIGYVVPLDKKDLLAYLKGEIDTCPGLVSKKAAAATSQSRLAKVTSSAPAAAAEPAKKQLERPAVAPGADKDTSTFAEYRMRDREQRSMDSVLMVKEWDFNALRDKLAQHVHSAKKGKADGGSKNGSNAYDPRGDRYTSNEDRFWRENLGSDFQDLGIDMSGSFKEKPSHAASNGIASDRARERPDARRSTKETPTKRARVDPKELIPIIIVPTGFSTLICHGNALDFFQDGRFVSIAELRQNKVSMVSKVSRVTATRTPGGNCSRAEYHIVFNPSRLTRSEWERVVAVVCSGQEWQFKNWPLYDGDLQELFRKVQGFYFHYDDTPPTKNAELWPIKKLRFSRSQRHTDGQVQVQFWTQLDGFLGRRGKHLRY